MVDLVRDALGMFYSLNGLVKSDTSMSLLGTPRGRNHGTGEVVQEYTESDVVLCEMEYGGVSYGLMSMVCVKRCLVTRMVYMGTRHSLQGEAGDSIL